MAGDYAACEALCHTLRQRCCVPDNPCPHGVILYKRLPEETPLPTAILYFKVVMMRIMMGNIHASMLCLMTLVEMPLKRKTYEDVLEAYFGRDIPTPFWDLPLFEEIITEEMIRVYLCDNARAERGVKFKWTPQQTFAAYSVSWTGPNVNLAHCSHSDAYWVCLWNHDPKEKHYRGRDTWKLVFDGSLRCDTCNEPTPHKCLESGKPFIYLCPGCPLRNCMSCREKREELIQKKDMSWSWKWG